MMIFLLSMMPIYATACRMVGSTEDCLVSHLPTILLLETNILLLNNRSDIEASCELSNQKLTPFPWHETTKVDVKSYLNLI